MEMKQPQGPFCQSCAMPMEKEEDFGTETDGSKSEDYCCYCFREGKFTDRDITMNEMMEKVIGIMVDKDMPEAQAKGIIENFLPKLKRWRGEP